MSFHEFIINGKKYEFHLLTNCHQWMIWIDGEPHYITKAKGQAIIDFLHKALPSQHTRL